MTLQFSSLRTDSLLRTASGQELLILAVTSNQRMRQQIEQELDRRSITVHGNRHVARQPVRLRLAA